ncbi:MAG TPA: GntG family PLP-dependent aldolase [Dinghuibacter sp.]|uniref:threonine aldolase family protein n=1 Tax=Dinghuibacter sp. TaxID=2024697 RepID=UPI002C7701F3|nr:GntG family PLP-dependent aldolase [Dinghuibacter sp.]HTJ13724.1 GntG family PLP-dependent aldolase [Dinghuibacter sp.]
MPIDLRSDTVTRPTPGMLEAMLQARVGDDVFREDSTVTALENRLAADFGMEAGIFCPSGTMTNQIAIKMHTQPADEVICDKTAHVYIYEGGGIAFNSGCQVRPLEGDRGRINAGQVVASINPDDVHRAITRLVCLENTANRGGGSCYEFCEIEAIRDVCDRHGLMLHLDGARIYNALVYKGETAAQYGQVFDSISICLSKGLGCPVGSVLIGRRKDIDRARRIRKAFGGGMRQAGYLAAAGLYALDNHISRLAEDHRHALELADALRERDFVGNILPVETNIVIFTVKGRYSAASLAEALRGHDILTVAIAPTQIRMVTHLDFTQEMVRKVRETLLLL